REVFAVRTFREARAAGRVAHPGVATVYDVLERELAGDDDTAALRAWLARMAGRYTEARSILRTTIRRRPRDDAASLRLALAETTIWDVGWSWSEAALEAAVTAGDPVLRADALAVHAIVCLAHGEVEAARRSARQAAELADAHLDAALAVRPALLAHLGWAATHSGWHTEALRHFTRGLAICHATNQAADAVSMLAGLSVVHLWLGEPAAALHWADRAVRLGEIVESDDLRAMALVRRAEAGLAAGDTGQALADSRLATTLSGPDSPWWRLSRVTWGAARLAGGEAEASAAVIIDAAGERLTELPVWARPHTAGLLARTQRGARGKRWAELSRRYAGLLRPPDVDAAPREPYRLSQREFEIATLVSEGRTNRQIARQLTVSHKTVETHLARIFAKVEVSSRAELAGLVGGARVVARPRRSAKT
ncbi:LuxR C-terminal-related transcriptional regulator, partial [Nonomuraea sp. NPDC004186]